MKAGKKGIFETEFACGGVIAGEAGGKRLKFSTGIWGESHEALMTTGENVPVRIGGRQLNIDAPDADCYFGRYFEQFETDRSNGGIGELRALQAEGAKTFQEQVCQSAEG